MELHSGSRRSCGLRLISIWTSLLLMPGKNRSHAILLESGCGTLIGNHADMKTLLLLILLAFIASALFGQTLPPSSKFDQSLLGGTNPALSDQEKAGVAITQAWRDKSLQTLVGQPGENASVQFRFGESLPTIVCAILNVTDIELQSGEIVTHINIGDSIRWTVESAVSGSGSNQIQHLVVKPREIGLSTSLIVTTDRRCYHLLLISDQGPFMHDVTFLYEPEQHTTLVASAALSPAPTPAKAAKADPPPRRKQSAGKQVVKDPPDDADEDYVIKGKPSWRPVSAYSKNGHTYIQMPPSFKHGDAPVLFEEKKSGLFGHFKNLVNYRVHGRWIVADTVIDNAVLVSGVGAGQQKVTVRHDKKKATEVASGN
jgi:P-type conjugative transfer protein TrbG